MLHTLNLLKQKMQNPRDTPSIYSDIYNFLKPDLTNTQRENGELARKKQVIHYFKKTLNSREMNVLRCLNVTREYDIECSHSVLMQEIRMNLFPFYSPTININSA
ncbi:hypothetical protein V8G54_013692 [Vigna mungo]|uniref:Uncharacterized protein n=1 Tax=Vigna mungo TaxID=3915 RepID=A0AAQ3NGC3_VIGMU